MTAVSPSSAEQSNILKWLLSDFFFLIKFLIYYIYSSSSFIFKEINKSVGTVAAAVEDPDMAECQHPEEESGLGAAAASEGSGHEVTADQDVVKESNATSSPDTDSPVMVNVDVSPLS